MLQKITSLTTRMKDFFSGMLKTAPSQEVPGDDEQDVFVLEPVKEFFETYIGVVITGYTTFQDDATDLEDHVKAKMVTGVRVDGDGLVVSLSEISGRNGGSIKINPSINGQFAERNSEELPTNSSRFRIIFYGNDVLEYIDPDNLGDASFIPVS